jgi:hypothetical protein
VKLNAVRRCGNGGAVYHGGNCRRNSRALTPRRAYFLIFSTPYAESRTIKVLRRSDVMR